MTRRTLLLAVLVIAGAAALVVRSRVAIPELKPRAQSISEIELAPICPWREPRRDLTLFFPGATNYTRETRILSGKRVELQQQLGRFPTAEENALLIHRITNNAQALGAVLVRRVKGEHGGIEVVTAIEPNGAIRGVAIQSHREPEPIAREIRATNWLAAFVGKNSHAAFRLGEDLLEVTSAAKPSAAKPSAQAIADGVRSELILFAVAEEADQAGHAHHQKHP